MPWLRLVRLPNVFTAVADVAMGFLFVRGNLTPKICFSLVAVASSCLYMGGMVLNDVFDVEQDRRERPERPLPSGAITLRQAAVFGAMLLVAGVAAAAVGPVCRTGPLPELGVAASAWHPALISGCLAIAILAYDGAIKRTWLGPANMGLCRALNVLLGMSAAGPCVGRLWGFDPSQLVVALGLGTYVSGVTWFARDEAIAKNRVNLILGILVMLLGLSILASFPWFPPFDDGTRQLSFAWPGFWPITVFALGVSVIRRCVIAAAQANPQRVQMAVKHCISSLIVLDAAVTMAVCDTIVWPLVVLSLLVPFVVLGRFVYST